MNLLKWLIQASPFRGLPTDDKGGSSSIQTISSETVQLYYYSGTTRTSDAGEAAGTLVVGQLAYTNIKNAGGYMEATDLDTSLSFTCTALTNEKKFYPPEFEYLDEVSELSRLTELGASYLTDEGDYCVDYSNGTIYANKATTASTMTSTTYKILEQQAGGGSVGANVNVAEWGGTATTLGQKTKTASVPVTLASDEDAITVIDAPAAPQAFGVDTTGADTYATIVTPSADATHIYISNEGSNPAIISVDDGTTDQFYVQGNSLAVFDDVEILDSVDIQAKNGNAGNNYTNLRITIW